MSILSNNDVRYSPRWNRGLKPSDYLLSQMFSVTPYDNTILVIGDFGEINFNVLTQKDKEEVEFEIIEVTDRISNPVQNGRYYWLYFPPVIKHSGYSGGVSQHTNVTYIKIYANDIEVTSKSLDAPIIQMLVPTEYYSSINGVSLLTNYNTFCTTFSIREGENYDLYINDKKITGNKYYKDGAYFDFERSATTLKAKYALLETMVDDGVMFRIEVGENKYYTKIWKDEPMPLSLFEKYVTNPDDGTDDGTDNGGDNGGDDNNDDNNNDSMANIIISSYKDNLEYIGGTVNVSVEYVDFDVVNLPMVYFDGQQESNNYLNPYSTMTNDIYNYQFDFPYTENNRVITVKFSGKDLNGNTVNKSITINQEGYNGEIIEIPAEFWLDGDEIEVGSEDDTFYISTNIKTGIQEENIGRVEIINNVDWIEINERGGGNTSYGYYKISTTDYEVYYAHNSDDISRTGVITFNYYDKNNILHTSIDYIVIQQGVIATDNIHHYSSWEDIIYSTDADIFNYEVVQVELVENGYAKESVIFEGRAFKYPDADKIDIKLNPIIFNYLDNSLINVLNTFDFNGDINTEVRNYKACKRFRIINRDNNQLLIEYRVLYDNSYLLKWRGTRETLSYPINNNISLNMLVCNTTVSPLGIVRNKFNNTNKPNTCGKYALYYLNNNGGWDSLLLNNKISKTKNIKYYTTEKYARNLNSDFEQYRYISELQNSYEIHTGFVTDEQSTNIAENLITSNEVYFHDLINNIVYAVLITDTSVKYKYYNDSLELPYYTINIKESQIQLKH